MAIIYKDINLLTQKSAAAGTEKLPVSDTEYITPDQIAALGIIGDGVTNIVVLTNAEYQALTTKDPNTVYIITDVDPGGGGGGGGGITEIDMNGSAVTVVGGVADLGTVITDISGKADKVSSPTSGNFAALDSNGNLTDSGHKHSDYLTSFTEQDPIFSASAAAGISSSDITNWNGKTSNIGTITSVKMNGSTVASSGEADLGTVITSETSLSKGSTTGNGNAVTDLSVSGHTITLTKGSTFLTSYTETDPVFAASAAHGISSTDISNWNAKQKAITVSSSEPTSADGSNGDIWIVI